MSNSKSKLESLSIPDEWSTFDEQIDDSISKSAQKAYEEVRDSNQKLPAVKQALAKFVSDWKELLEKHPDLAETLAADRVEKYFNDLAQSSGSGAETEAVWHEINMGMVDLKRVDFGAFVNRCAEKAKCSAEFMARIVENFVKTVKSELQRCGRAKVKGFGSFFVSERAVHAKGKEISNRNCVDFRSCTEVTKCLTKHFEFSPYGLTVSDFGKKVAAHFTEDEETVLRSLECFVSTLVLSLGDDEGKNATVIEGLGTFSRRKLRAAFAEDITGKREMLPPSYSIAFLADKELLEGIS